MLSKEEVDRQDFEAWYTNIWHPLNMRRNRFGNYIATDHTMAWEGWQARSAELLSLREQLAELKALPPFAWGLADKDGDAYLSECCIGDEGCMIDEAEGYNYELEPEHHIHAVPLFTAAKPAGSDNG